ncbi:MAG TPA: hypothetical protein G4O02_07140 [Caldilineae bacterium]|nr:hypothetical protein [Caldilineae bacterium]
MLDQRSASHALLSIIDILVDLQEPHFDALARRFPPPRYYADPEQMRHSTRLGMLFNIIDTSQGVKADLAPLTGEPAYEERHKHIKVLL